MAIMDPVTLEGWGQYIANLKGATLYSQAAAANTQPFVNMLSEEGFSSEDITDVLLLFALQCQRDPEITPPNGLPDEYINYASLISVLEGESSTASL
jgi:hypothetical protein